MDKKFLKVKNAARALATLKTEKINRVLKNLATETIKQTKQIIKANKKDLAKMNPADPKYDRLLLNQTRIKSISADLENVAKLPSPLNRILKKDLRPNGLKISKISVPLGVIGIIYESRPNVTFDVFALCFKSGNACVLKGSSEAENSNKAIVKIIQMVLKKHRLDPNTILLMPSDRKSVQKIFHAHGLIDVIIPRGSQNLINFVRENSKIPIIETGAGIVHTFIDQSADIKKAAAIIFNAKTRRPSVCNALDTLLIHEKLLNKLPEIIKPLSAKQVEIFADTKSYEKLQQKYPKDLLKKARTENFGTEYLALKISIKTVRNIDQAIAWINRYGSQHSEAIISENKTNIQKFLKNIDAAAVYSNTSTAFTDGAQFGLGAEIGISTQKLHARGPMALEELTSYKWIIEGTGQIRK